MAFPFSKSRSLLTSCLHLKLLPSVSTLHSEYCQPLLTCLHVCTWNFSKLYNTPPAFKTQIDIISAGQEESVPRSSIHPGGSCDILRSIVLGNKHFKVACCYDIFHSICRKSSNRDACTKNYEKTKSHCPGVFSVGCACPRSITFGYELMINPESSNNPFRLISCRDIDIRGQFKGLIKFNKITTKFHKSFPNIPSRLLLKTSSAKSSKYCKNFREILLTALVNIKYWYSGIIYDNGCNTHTYIQQREPREWEYMRCIIDRAHYSGHRRGRNG